MPPDEVKDQDGNLIPVSKYYELRKVCKDTESWIWDRKEECMRDHFNKIVWSDAILVLNYPKSGVQGHIGGNTFLEMGLAFHLKKPIYLFFSIPETKTKEEILGMKPICLNGRLEELLRPVQNVSLA